MNKPIWLSKTFWVNTLTVVITVLEQSEMTHMLPPEHQAAFLMGLAVLNIVLRMVTHQGVTIK